MSAYTKHAQLSKQPRSQASPELNLKLKPWIRKGLGLIPTLEYWWLTTLGTIHFDFYPYTDVCFTVYSVLSESCEQISQAYNTQVEFEPTTLAILEQCLTTRLSVQVTRGSSSTLTSLIT